MAGQYGESGTGYESNRAEYSEDRPNFGSARSDYGSNAYGGSLNKQGIGGKSVDDFSERRRDVGSRGYGQLRRQSTFGTGAGTAAVAGGGVGLLLVGIGIGAGLMYLLDPERGRKRRALLRDKAVALSNDASDAIGKTSRDLGNRAQGVVAETSKALGVNAFGSQEKQEEPEQSKTAGTSSR